MADSTDKKGPGRDDEKAKGFPGAGDDDLMAEFDAWDKNLDSLFGDESTADSIIERPGTSGQSGAEDHGRTEASGDEFVKALDFLEESGELDRFFNDSPPPLPPVDEEFEQAFDQVLGHFGDEGENEVVISSAARPATPEHSAPVVGDANRPAEPAEPEIEVSLFDELDDDDEPPGEVTRILDSDDPLFAATVAASTPGVKPPTLPESARPSPRRTPSIVRRTELERMRAQRSGHAVAFEDDDSDDEFGFSAETTRIADAQQLENLMESAARTHDPGADEPEEAEITVAVDEEFYDDIEIGEGAIETDEPAVRQSRIVSRHVVRREAAEPARPSDPRIVARAIISDDDEVTGELRPGSDPRLQNVQEARVVDPEMTLDLRGDDMELASDLDDGESYGEEIDGFDDAFSARTVDHGARPSKPPSSPAVRPSRTRVGHDPSSSRPSSSFDDDETNIQTKRQSSRQVRSQSSRQATADPDAAEPTNVAWPPKAPGQSSFLDLDPSPRDSGAHPPQRPSHLTGLSLPFLEDAADFGEVPTVDPAAEKLRAQKEREGEQEITAVRSGARTIPDGALPASERVATVPRAARPSQRALAKDTGGDSLDTHAMPQATPPQPGQESKAADALQAPNSTYDFGLPRVVPTTAATHPVSPERPASAQPTTPPGAPAEPPVPPGARQVPLGEQATPRASEPEIATRTARPAADAAPQGREGEADWPTLPQPVLPTELPGLDNAALAAIDVPEKLDTESFDSGAHTEALARELAVYERELEREEFGAMAKEFRLQAGRISEELGDLDRARVHYEEALAQDPLLPSALGGLRRIERVSGDWNAAMNYLDAELENASPVERGALTAHKADVLMAVGEQDLARVVVGERLDAEPGNIRALLANLELAFVDDRDDEFDATLDRLATALQSPELVGCMHVLRGRLSERPVGQPSGDLAAAMSAYGKAADAGSADALVAMAMAAHGLGDLEAAISAIGRLASTGLETLDPGYVAALEWRRARWARLAGYRETEREALERAASLGGGPLVLAELANLEEARGDMEGAIAALARLAEEAASPAERASAEVRLASCLNATGRGAEAADALRRAAALDPSDPVATDALERVLEASEDLEALIELGRRAAESDPVGAVFERVRTASRLMQAGQYERAIADLEAGRAAVPDSPAISDALLDAYALAGDFEKRLALLQELTDAPGEMRDAEALLLQLARAAAAHVNALGQARDEIDGRIEALAGDDAAAQERVAADGEADTRASLEAERAALEEQRARALTLALDAWNRVLEGDPESADAHAAIARLCAVLGQPDMLDDALARAQGVAHDADHAVTLAMARASLALAEAEPDMPRVEDIAREAMELAPADPRPPLLLLELALRQQRFLDAAMLLEERAARTEDADHAASLRYRSAVLLLGRADEPAQAAELLRSVIENRPGFEPARELLEMAHRRLGEPMSPLPERDDAGSGGKVSFDQLVRQAEAQFFQYGDAARSAGLFSRALRERPGDAMASYGLRLAARAAGEPAALAELAIAELTRAENLGDTMAKADAYEELAYVDGELRGDADSARMALESAAGLDDSRIRVWRALERMHVAAGQWAELLDVRGGQLPHLERAEARVAWHLDRARLASKAGRAGAEVLDEYRAVYEIDGRCRRALFHLESEARQHGPSDGLAALEADIARYFEADERARAAFLTRSAETLAELGELDLAMERFRAASDLAGGFAAAIAGWRHAAIAGERWNEVADAAMREAERSDVDSEQVALYHLAGVAAMDKAQDLERATEALEKVLALDPEHDDAFARLYRVYMESERHADVVALLEQRLEIEAEDEVRARLHRAIADLMRTHLEDLDGASHHLREVLELVPNEPGAIEILSEVAWQQGAWDDAIETLLVRARLARDPQTQRDVFFRLGVIYVEHRPETQWALKSFQKVLSIEPNDQEALEYLARLGSETKDWQLALRACERLVELEEDVERKVGYMHRMGRIFSEGLNDRVRAERVYRSALELAPESGQALNALVEFFESGGDQRSMRVHLDRVLGTMRARLQEGPHNGRAFRVLAHALAARERAGVPGSRAAARCAAELALIIEPEAEEEAEEEIAEEMELAREAEIRPRIVGLDQPEIDDLLFPRVVSNAARQIFALVGERVAKHVGIDLRRYGVGRADRLKGGEHPIEHIAQGMAAELEMDVPTLYISSKVNRLLVVEPTHPISVVVSADIVQSANEAQLRFAIGRSIKLASSAFAVPARMNLEEFGVLMVSLLRLFDADFAALGVDAEAVAAQQQRMRRLIPNSLIQELRPFAVSMAGPGFDYTALYHGIQAAGNRAGLLACGSVRAAVTILGALRGIEQPALALTDPEIDALVRFSISDDHVNLRGQLGG